MLFKTRNYRYKGGNTGAEQKNFWIYIAVGLLIGIGIVYLL